MFKDTDFYCIFIYIMAGFIFVWFPYIHLLCHYFYYLCHCCHPAIKEIENKIKDNKGNVIEGK